MEIQDIHRGAFYEGQLHQCYLGPGRTLWRMQLKLSGQRQVELMFYTQYAWDAADWGHRLARAACVGLGICTHAAP